MAKIIISSALNQVEKLSEVIFVVSAQVRKDVSTH
jgi:hypothetical protein